MPGSVKKKKRHAKEEEIGNTNDHLSNYFNFIRRLENFSRRNSQPKFQAYFLEMSKEDSEEIRLLFTELFKVDEFGYTLFGDKPMSFS